MRTVAATLLAVLSVGCGAGQHAGRDPTPIAVSPACSEAFDAAQAALTGRAEPGSPAPHAPVSPVPTTVAGSLADLYPTIAACGTTDEWFEAYRAHPTPLTADVAPSEALRALCSAGRGRRDVASSELCARVRVEQTVPDPRSAKRGARTDPGPGAPPRIHSTVNARYMS
ncbi:MAG: hypothetical protein KY462_11875 [Actinobacteria bacterium]|nr:hypothetical protein [Actinomycetota bacterium]